MAEGVDYSLLGTVVNVDIASGRFVSSERLVSLVLAEMRRLESVFNLFDPASAITLYRASGRTDNDQLRHVQMLGQEWKSRTGGLFDPGAGAALDLNGIAKGWILDSAAQRARRARRIVINAGGDIMHRGSGAVRVGIEDPARPYDNVAPARFIKLDNAAIATSGPARRGDHLWNGATADAPSAIASASVVAADAATADALATAFAVGDPEQSFAIAEHNAVATHLVLTDGQQISNDRWTTLET